VHEEGLISRTQAGEGKGEKLLSNKDNNLDNRDHSGPSPYHQEKHYCTPMESSWRSPLEIKPEFLPLWRGEKKAGVRSKAG